MPFPPRRDAVSLTLALFLPTLVTWVYFIWLADEPAVWQQTAYVLGKLVQFGFPLFWYLQVQRERLKLTLPQKGDWIEGGGLGLVIVAAMLGLHFAWFRKHLPDEVVEAIRNKVDAIGVGTGGADSSGASGVPVAAASPDRKSTRLNSSHRT